MKKVLLTGATGFVGRHCLPALARRGFEIHAVSSKLRSGTGTELEVRWHQTNLWDQTHVLRLLEQIQATHLLHCAWYAVPGKYWDAPENFQWVEASLHLFRTFADVGGRRAVGVGTCAEYDWSEGLCSETSTPIRPTTAYGACKRDLERRLNELGRQTGLSTAWGRLFFLYGPNEQKERLVASVISSLLQNRTAVCLHGEHLRDFLYVEDAADALASLLDSEVSGAVNIASGVPIRLRDLIYEIASQLGKADLIQLNARPAPDNEPPFLAARIDRLRNEVGWSPRYDLKRGLAETISWWKVQVEKW